MKRLLLLSLLFAASCRSAPAQPIVAAPNAPTMSALGALTRVLEAVDRFQRPGVVLRLRAIESDSLRLHAPLRERVRVFLHLTAMAPSLDAARNALEDLQIELEGAGAQLGTAPGPGTHLFLERDWTPAPVAGFSSYSDALRIEVDPHLPLPAGPKASAPAVSSSASPDDFLESVARATGIDARAQRGRLRQAPDGSRELRCLVAPDNPDAHETLAAIGGFLEGIEDASPAARWTHLEIERALDVAEGLQPNGWTFEGELLLTER